MTHGTTNHHDTGPPAKLDMKTAKRMFWSDSEIRALIAAYTSPSLQDLDDFPEKIGRTKAAIYCKAESLGLTTPRGTQKPSEAGRRRMSEAQKLRCERPEERARMGSMITSFHQTNPHPKGFLGHTHTQAAREAISAGSKGKPVPDERIRRQMESRIKSQGSLSPKVQRGTWKASWVEIGGKRFYSRSRWEANYGRYLELLKSQGHILEWEHEPETFWFEKIRRGVRSYLPDYRVTQRNGSVEYHEVKGWMCPRSKTCLKRMKKYHPLVTVLVIDGTWFKQNARKLQGIISDWQ